MIIDDIMYHNEANQKPFAKLFTFNLAVIIKFTTFWKRHNSGWNKEIIRFFLHPRNFLFFLSWKFFSSV